MEGPYAHPPKTKAMQQLANRPFVQNNAETGFNFSFKVNTTPTYKMAFWPF
jgi:hypothetical protein